MALRIATFNLENLDDGPAAQVPLGARLPTLRAQLARLEADILCLQEVNAQESRQQRRLDALDQLLAGSAYEGYARAWTGAEGKKGALSIHNLVILSRTPIRASQQLWHDLVKPPTYRSPQATEGDAPLEVRWERPLLHAEIDLGEGTTLHVVNLHLRAARAAFIEGQKDSTVGWRSVAGWAEGLFAAAVKQAGQALELRLLIERLLDADEGALIAVCGDFNADTLDMPVRIARGDPADIGNSALAPRALVALEGGFDDAGRYSVIHGPRQVMLDHILVSRALALRCRQIAIDTIGLIDEMESDSLSTRRLGSYHAPLVATFDLP
jgi:endonuclease/exonuclease/phosphatase family metal-dependent hydrolase